MPKRLKNPSVIATATLLVTAAATLGLLATGALFPEKEKAKPKAKKKKSTKSSTKKKSTTKPSTKKKAPPKTPPPNTPKAPVQINNGIFTNANCTKATVFDRATIDDVIGENIVHYLDTGAIGEVSLAELNLNNLDDFLVFASTMAYEGVLKNGVDTRNCAAFVVPWDTAEEFDQISKFEKALWLLLMLRTGLIMFDAELIPPQVYSDFVQKMNLYFHDHNIDNNYLKQAGLS